MSTATTFLLVVTLIGVENPHAVGEFYTKESCANAANVIKTDMLKKYSDSIDAEPGISIVPKKESLIRAEYWYSYSCVPLNVTPIQIKK